MRISSMIVPGWVYHNDDPENKKLTYALVDDQLEACNFGRYTWVFSVSTRQFFVYFHVIRYPLYGIRYPSIRYSHFLPCRDFDFISL